MSDTEEIELSIPKPPRPSMVSSRSLVLSSEDLRIRQEEIDRRAQELLKREQELQSVLLPETTPQAPKNNWPPFPEGLPLKPCFHQDINVDIPGGFRKTMRNLYHVWIIHVSILLINAFVFTLRLIFVVPFTQSLGGFFLAFMYLFLFIPGSYVCWFRPAYKAFKNGSSFYFMIFFFVFFFQFVTTVGLSVLMPGACQIVDGIRIITYDGLGNVIIGILILAVGSAFVVVAALDFYMLVKVHKIYRSTGASFLKAQREVASAAINNDHVHGAVSDIATEVIRTHTDTMNAK